MVVLYCFCFFFFQAEDGIRDYKVTGVQTCALPISRQPGPPLHRPRLGLTGLEELQEHLLSDLLGVVRVGEQHPPEPYDPRIVSRVEFLVLRVRVQGRLQVFPPARRLSRRFSPRRTDPPPTRLTPGRPLSLV